MAKKCLMEKAARLKAEKAAAKQAEIYDDILAMPAGFDTYVGERGWQEASYEVQCPRIQPLPDLRAPSCVHAQVQRVPSVLQGACGQWHDPWRHEGIVVTERNSRNDY